MIQLTFIEKNEEIPNNKKNDIFLFFKDLKKAIKDILNDKIKDKYKNYFINGKYSNELISVINDFLNTIKEKRKNLDDNYKKIKTNEVPLNNSYKINIKDSQKNINNANKNLIKNEIKKSSTPIKKKNNIYEKQNLNKSFYSFAKENYSKNIKKNVYERKTKIQELEYGFNKDVYDKNLNAFLLTSNKILNENLSNKEFEGLLNDLKMKEDYFNQNHSIYGAKAFKKQLQMSTNGIIQDKNEEIKSILKKVSEIIFQNQDYKKEKNNINDYIDTLFINNLTLNEISNNKIQYSKNIINFNTIKNNEELEYMPIIYSGRDGEVKCVYKEINYIVDNFVYNYHSFSSLNFLSNLNYDMKIKLENKNGSEIELPNDSLIPNSISSINMIIKKENNNSINK